jgi:hypothetical protein
MIRLRPQQRWAFIVIFTLPSLISLACATITGGLPASPDQQDIPIKDQQNIPIKKDVDYGTGPFELVDPQVGLSDLSSYKASLTLAFEGTRAGSAEKWSKTYVMLTTREPAARQLTIEKSGDIAGAEPVFRAELDGTEYEKSGEQACDSAAIQEGNSLAERFEPALFLDGVIGADAVGNETVNDIASDHYTFNQSALGQQNVTESIGEVWVASKGGYVVKYLLTSNGTSIYFGEGIEGTLSIDYELTEVNAPVEITLPADCPPGLVDAPLMTDAANVLNMGGILAYDTSTSVAETAAFYQKGLEELGWKPLQDPAVSESGTILNYTQGNQTMTVIIAANNGVTTVHVAISRAQE